MLFHSLQVFADFVHNGICNNLLCFLIPENFFSVGKTDIDRGSYIKRKCIDKIVIGRAICCPLYLRDYIIQFLCHNLFGYKLHLPAVFL